MKNTELVELLDHAITDFKGDLNELEKAIGMLMIGRRYGWKVMFLIHRPSTIKKYEKILQVKIRDILPETSDKTEKSLAWRALQKVSNFWKAVNGEYKGIRTVQSD